MAKVCFTINEGKLKLCVLTIALQMVTVQVYLTSITFCSTNSGGNQTELTVELVTGCDSDELIKKYIYFSLVYRSWILYGAFQFLNIARLIINIFYAPKFTYIN